MSVNFLYACGSALTDRHGHLDFHAIGGLDIRALGLAHGTGPASLGCNDPSVSAQVKLLI
jgi:hypothetical protein